MSRAAVSRPGVVVHRPVRAYPRPVPAAELTVAAPPTVGWTGSGAAAWLQYLVPLLGSGGSVALLFAVPGPRRAWLVAVIVGGAVASVVLGLWLRLVERRATGRARRRERTRYLAHLDRVAAEAARLAATQSAAALHLHPDPPRLWALVNQGDRLWERRPADDDFLQVRIGRGPVPLAAFLRLEPGGGPLVEQDPDLLAAAEDLVRRDQWLPDAPVTIPLRRLGVLAVTGPPDHARALVRSLLCHLAALHAPDDLRILAAFPPTALPGWEWLKWLPHTRGPTPGEPDDGGPAACSPSTPPSSPTSSTGRSAPAWPAPLRGPDPARRQGPARRLSPHRCRTWSPCSNQPRPPAPPPPDPCSGWNRRPAPPTAWWRSCSTGPRRSG